MALSNFHLSGKSNCAADATSRYPTCYSEDDDDNTNEFMKWVIASQIRSEAECVAIFSWGAIAQATQADRRLSKLLPII